MPNIIPQLTIPPYADDVFTDLERGKQFLVLHFRHDGAVLPRITEWTSRVLAGIAPAGLVISQGCDIELTPRTQPVTAQTQWKGLVKVPVKLAGELPAGQDFVEAVRERYRK